MSRTVGLVFAAALPGACGKAPDDASHLDEARRMAAEHIIVDTHIDVPCQGARPGSVKRSR